MATSVVRRGNGLPTTMRRAERTEIDAVTFRPIGRDSLMTRAESLAANHTGASSLFIVRRLCTSGTSACWPLSGNTSRSPKSFVATVAVTVIAEAPPDDGAAGRELSAGTAKQRER
jgi:hypothetical protein